jgi:hypothetical protein
VVLGDPALVVALVGTGGGASRLGTGEGLGSLGLLGLLGARGAGRTARLGEEGLDPGLVDEVQGAAEDAGQEEVEEDAGTQSGMRALKHDTNFPP